MRLSGDQSEQLFGLIRDHFTVGDLTRLIRFKCDRDPYNIDSFQDKQSGIFHLLDVAEKEGWLLQLTKAVMDARPGVLGFEQIFTDLKAHSDISTKSSSNSKTLEKAEASGRQSILLGDWYGAEIQSIGPKGEPIYYPLRLQIRSVIDGIRGVFRFTFRSEEKSLDESLDFEGELLLDRFLRLRYDDVKKVQLGALVLELSDDGHELSGFDVGYGFTFKQVATARTSVRKQATVTDPRLNLLERGAFPKGWGMRVTFAHPKAANLWKTRKLAPENETALIDAYIALLSDLAVNWDLVVSFGPGDALVDSKLAAALAGRVKRYIPIEISQAACEAAIRSLTPICEVPIGIVGDFEQGFDFIRGALEQCDPGRLLIICTGNVLGNLDVGERLLFDNLSNLTKPGDTLLLSVATGAFTGTIDRATFDASVYWDDLKELISCGLENITGEDREMIGRELDGRIDVRAGSSDVPGATSRELYDRQTGRTAMRFRRYDFEQLAKWISARFLFRIIKSVREDTSVAGLGMGSFVLTRT